MGLYDQKTKDELLEIVKELERKVEDLTSELSSLETGRFRDKYSTLHMVCFRRRSKFYNICIMIKDSKHIRQCI